LINKRVKRLSLRLALLATGHRSSMPFLTYHRRNSP